MFLLLSIFVIWFIGAVLTQTAFRCADKFQGYNDTFENIGGTIIWPVSLVCAIGFYIFKGVNVVANLITAKVCPNQVERRR